jgi:hypothetical protein
MVAAQKNVIDEMMKFYIEHFPESEKNDKA